MRVPYSVTIPVWSSLDGPLQPIEVTMEVIPDSISNLSRVDTAIAPLNASNTEVFNLTAAAYESSPGTSVSGLAVAFYVHALDQYGNPLDAVEMNPAVDVFRTDTAGQERQAFQVLPLTTVTPLQGGFPGLLQGAHCAQNLEPVERTQYATTRVLKSRARLPQAPSRTSSPRVSTACSCATL